MFLKIGVLKDFTLFTGKQKCHNFCLIKLLASSRESGKNGLTKKTLTTAICVLIYLPFLGKYSNNHKSSHAEVFQRIDNSHENICKGVLFKVKLPAACNFINERFHCICFAVNFAKFFGKDIL